MPQALISVSAKDQLDVLVEGLVKHGFSLISSGGTAAAIRKLGYEVQEVSAVTGFPESPAGLVKTLHPAIHFGILMDRENTEHQSFAKTHKITPIDLVVCNLYPFKDAMQRVGVTSEELRDQIDIGGVTLIRAAAKNWKQVTVLTSPSDYSTLVELLNAQQGVIPENFREQMAVKAFEHTTTYDSEIYVKLNETLLGNKALWLKFGAGRELRYGQNWHQKAAFYANNFTDEANIGHYTQHHGKALSYNNFVDGDAALEACKDLGNVVPGVVIVKHTIQCGIATGKNLAAAFDRAWACDPVSAFGSVIAVTQELDLETAHHLDKKFIEIIIAPTFSNEALDYLKKDPSKKNLRILEVGPFGTPNPKMRDYRCVSGGILEQDRDLELIAKWETVTQTAFPESKKALALFAVLAAKHIKSNVSVIAREYEPGYYDLLSIGSGQPNRVDTLARLAIPKAKERLEREHEDIAQVLSECVFASEAFFPFRDTIDAAASFGLKYIVQPGGSIKDQEVIDAANEHGLAMVFTGMRHFKH